MTFDLDKFPKKRIANQVVKEGAQQDMSANKQEMKKKLKELWAERYEHVKSKASEDKVSAEERDTRFYTFVTLSSQIEELQQELNLDALESLEEFSKKLHKMTWALIGLTTILGILTLVLVLVTSGIHI